MQKSAFVAVLGFVAAIAMGSVAQAQEMKFFRIVSGSAGGNYFPMAGLLANAVSNPPGSRPCEKGGSCGVPGLVAIAQSANGSVANVNAIQSGTAESGFVQSDVAYWAYNGTGVFDGKEKLEKLRFMASLYPEFIHIVASKNSGIESVADMKGKRIGVGLPASGAQVGALLILEANGLKKNEDYSAEELNTSDSANKVRDGQLDAFLTVTGAGSSGIQELATTAGLKLIPISAEGATKVIEKAPFYGRAVIPGGTYTGVDMDTPTVAVMAQWLVSADQPDDLVYGITKSLWNETTQDLLSKGPSVGKHVTKETALDARGIPFHPGAEKFYKEVGLVK